VKFLDNKDIFFFLLKIVDGKSIVRGPKEILIMVLQYKKQQKKYCFASIKIPNQNNSTQHHHKTLFMALS
jgi:hypothetical protein